MTLQIMPFCFSAVKNQMVPSHCLFSACDFLKIFRILHVI